MSVTAAFHVTVGEHLARIAAEETEHIAAAARAIADSVSAGAWCT